MQENGVALDILKELDTSSSSVSSSIEPIKILHFLIALILFFIAFKISAFIFNKIYEQILKLQNNNGFAIKLRNYNIVSSENIAQVLDIVFKLAKASFFLFLFYSLITYSLNIFPATQSISSKLLKYFIYLVKFFFSGILGFIPNLITIFVIVIITYYILEFTKFIVRGLYQQKIVFSGFKREWILPTYQIVRFFIFAFALVMIFPYLPGADSPAFQGVSVFLGVLLSLGSTSAIANMVAGIVLIYMSPCTVGDRVKLGDLIGDIEEMGLLVMRIKTIYNEDVTIPNSIVLAKEVVNYTKSTQSKGELRVKIPVGLGYDIPTEKVDELLLAAVEGVDNVQQSPEAFVLVKELTDFCINYELNVHIDNADFMLKIKSDLQRNIIKNFNQAGLEILSPAFIATRDGGSK